MRKLLKEQGFAPRLLVTVREFASGGAATKAQFHLHHDNEVAYVLSGEVTFMIGDEVTVGTAAFSKASGLARPNKF